LRLNSRIAVGALALLVSGCAGTRWNEPLARIDVRSGYRFLPPMSARNSESLFVVLSFSGGGTRAAAFSYGAMRKLRDTTIEVSGEKRRLLDEVDVISSISGGSFTAAYYGLFRERLFEDFDHRFLKRQVQSDLIMRFLSPWNWPRLLTPGFDRIDLAAEYYGRYIFEDQTFAALERQKQTPLIVLNATDMARSSRFEFTQDEFDLLCSDLSKYPVARAVAASSAFPFALTPVTIKAYPRACGYREPVWLADAREERKKGSRRFYNAEITDAYLDPELRFVHLLDGGLADNIGLRGPLQSLSSTDNPRSAQEGDGDRSILQKINRKKIDTILVITVNARTRSRNELDRQENAPGLVGMIEPVASGPMGNYSYETVELLKESMRQWTTDADQVDACHRQFKKHCRKGKLPDDFMQRVAYYPVELTFDSIEDPTKRERLQSMATSFELPAAEVDELVSTAGELLDESPSFHKFLQAFGGR
jgi:NTE family protein